MDPLAREIDRLATGIAALRIVYLLAKGDRDMSLKYLAERQRDRMERITARAAKLDERGDVTEGRFNEAAAGHEGVLDEWEKQIEEVEAFNHEMLAGSNQVRPTPKVAAKVETVTAKPDDTKPQGTQSDASPARDPQTGDVVVAHGSEARIVGLEPVKS